MSDAGLSAQQLSNADTIIRVGVARHASTKDIETAVMVALTESSLQNYASSNVPESLSYPHDNVGSDSDSVGLFQQRPSQGWGTVAELMDPATAATKFYDALDKWPSRDSVPAWITAQRVQKSFDPTGSNYLVHWPTAVQVVEGSGTAQLASDTKNHAATASTNPLEALQKTLGYFNEPGNWKRIGLFALGAFFLGFALWKLAVDSGAVSAVTKAAKNAAEVIPL